MSAASRSRCGIRFVTLMVMFGTIALTGYLYVIIPKGFFPQQDTGLIIGMPKPRRIFRFPPWQQRQQAVIDTVLKDPAVDSVGARSAPAETHAQPGHACS